MIRKATQEETAIIRGSLEAIQRGLFDAFLSGKMLAILEEDPSRESDAGAGTGDADGADAGAKTGDADGADAATGGTVASAAPGAPARRHQDGTPTGTPARPLGVVLVDGAVLAMPGDLLAGATGGLQVGVLDDGFALDLQGAIVMARETRRQAVRVNEKATRLFLYGRDILGTSILEFDPSLHMGDHCIVTNPRREALGIGRVVGNFKAPRSAVEAVHDLGSYLRDE